MDYFLGLDFGSSGARACVIDANGVIHHAATARYPAQDSPTPLAWREALLALLGNIPAAITRQLARIAIDGTSGTVLLCDTNLRPIYAALPYDDSRAQAEAQELCTIAPPGHTVCAATSGLAKFLWLTQHAKISEATYFLHQADWLAALLTGQGGTSDYHNALKTGYDAADLCWPPWVLELPHSHLLPQVVAPGTPLAPILPAISQHFGINPACTICAGTTDSIAAFIAAGPDKPGEAVTSLGTTTVLKLLSEKRVEAAEFGVYSHRYGDLWLAGGASNAGGGTLSLLFPETQLAALSQQIDAAADSPLDYYPLIRPGERFPINDPALPPRISPRPVDDKAFLHGLLQGLATIEAAGYAKLVELGAPALHAVTTCGGGARNPAWLQIRQRLLAVPVKVASHTEAAYGAALLAMRGSLQDNRATPRTPVPV